MKQAVAMPKVAEATSWQHQHQQHHKTPTFEVDPVADMLPTLDKGSANPRKQLSQPWSWESVVEAQKHTEGR
jgi:hypothetical protein